MLGSDTSLEPVKTLLKARTAGNPFFLEECVRTLVETGSRPASPWGLSAGSRPTGVADPGHGAGVAGSAYRPSARRGEALILQSAALSSAPHIPLVLLQDIAELSEEALHRGLTHLQGAEFLYETRLFPETEYTFKHALTHNVAYESLLHERRRLLHQRVGRGDRGALC